MKFVNRVLALGRDDSGQDLLEYALLASLIALLCYAAMEATGASIRTFYDSIAARVDGILS